MDQQVFSIKEVAKIFGVSESTIYRSVKEGSFPQPIRVGKRRRGWIRVDIEIFFSKRTFQPVANDNQLLAYSKTWRAGHGQQNT